MSYDVICIEYVYIDLFWQAVEHIHFFLQSWKSDILRPDWIGPFNIHPKVMNETLSSMQWAKYRKPCWFMSLGQ